MSLLSSFNKELTNHKDISFITIYQSFKKICKGNDLCEIATDFNKRILCNSRNCICKPWLNVDHGYSPLINEENVIKYVCAYGKMHYEKLIYTFKKFNNWHSLINNNITIFDWGCGIGLATIALLDYLKNNSISFNNFTFYLIEPSQLSLNFAKIILNHYNITTNTIFLNKQIEDINESEIIVKNTTRLIIHLFSNVLDISHISLSKIAHLVNINNIFNQLIFCISPININSHRLDYFINYFELPKILSKNEIRSLPQTGRTLKYIIFELKQCSKLKHFEYYQPILFSASYAISKILKTLNKEDFDNYKNFIVYSNYPIDSFVYDNVHPILAVLNNMIIRGNPTFASPFIESYFCQYGSEKIINETGTIDFEYNKINFENIKNSIEFLLPISVARIHKIINEILIYGLVNLNEEINVLIIERDIECAKIAITDYVELFNNLCKLTQKYSNLSLNINLTSVYIPFEKRSFQSISRSKPYIEKRIPTHVSEIASKHYDIVIDISVIYSEYTNILVSENWKYYFIIRNIDKQTIINKNFIIQDQIYCSEPIIYKPLVNKDTQGNYIEIKENKEILKYFLQLLFRKEDFLPGQLAILSQALQYKSVIGLLPTGGGKSLTYQLASLLQPGIALIVDPIRSLMVDQYENLLKLNIDKCTYINSYLTPKEKVENQEKLAKGKVLFAFISPERLAIQEFRDYLEKMYEINLFFTYGIIDEVHCVSEWGHDFRFSYLHLGRNLSLFAKNYYQKSSVCFRRSTDDTELPPYPQNPIPIIGLTATASFDVLADVEREITGNGYYQFDSDSIIRFENVNRIELQYLIYPINCLSYDKELGDYLTISTDNKNKHLKKLSLINEVINKIPNWLVELNDNADLIRNNFFKRENKAVEENFSFKLKESNIDILKTCGIIFCPHRQNTHLSVIEVIKKIKNSFNNISIGFFMGSKNNENEDFDKYSLQNLKEFIKGNLKWMVATKAFGMGIDKPNVRFSIHMNYPPSLENFVQEAGRIGRDRKLAIAIILYNTIPQGLVKIKNTYSEFKYPIIKLKNYYLKYSNLENIIKIYNFDQNIYNNIETYDYSIEKHPDYVVNLYFYENSFKGINHEIKILNEILNSIKYENNKDFFTTFNESPINSFFTITLYYDEKKFTDYSKAIYRMASIGLVADYTHDYNSNSFKIKIQKKEDNFYISELKKFLKRYYNELRAEKELSKIHSYEDSNTIVKCLKFLTTFIYEKIALKRKRAIADMHNFCEVAINSSKSWIEINEELKDYLYYYFNSKYAREGYTADNGEPFSLVDDTERGKLFSWELTFKYLRVKDDDLLGTSTPIDNIKHLQGAVRLIRRALPDINPTISLLNAFCLIFLGVGNNVKLIDEIKNDLFDGINTFFKNDNSYLNFWTQTIKFLNEIKNYIENDNNFKSNKLDLYLDELTLYFHIIIFMEISKKYLSAN